MSSATIESFLHGVRRRLDDGLRSRVIARAMVVAAMTTIAWALAWRVFGYAAPRAGYAVVAATAVAAALLWWMLARHRIRQAAATADAVFELKDGLISWLDFRAAGCQGEVYQLNERDLAQRVAALDGSRVPLARPRKTLLAAALLAAAALLLALLPHSAAQRERLASEVLASQRGKEVETQVEEAIDEIIRSMSAAERELLQPAALREWAKQLEASKDARANELQLARLEQHIAQAVQGLEARHDEAVLKLAADELAKSSLADVRQLGKQLDAKEFAKAAREMKQMKPGAKPRMTPEQWQKLRENAAESRDMAQRMAAGARRRDFNKLNPAEGNNANPAKPAGEDAPEMADMLEDLDAAARDLAKELGEREEPGEEAEAMAGKVDGKMDELGKRLGKLDARQKAKSKLDALRRGLGEARQFAQGKTQSLGLARSMQPGTEPGGREPGQGSDPSRREQRDEANDQGGLAEIKGNPVGEGPTSSSVESAESGSGIAGRARIAKQREFKQQLESLVHRDDIPEALKLGVREYFQTVHQIDPAEK